MILPEKTLVLIIGLCLITVILFVVALNAPKDTEVQNEYNNTEIWKAECRKYGDLPLNEVPAKCIPYFK